MASAPTPAEALDVAHEINKLLDCGLDKESLSVCVALLETGVNPEALAVVVQRLRTQAAALAQGHAQSPPPQ
jgi:mitotic-spindle organizing protein 1